MHNWSESKGEWRQREKKSSKGAQHMTQKEEGEVEHLKDGLQSEHGGQDNRQGKGVLKINGCVRIAGDRDSAYGRVQLWVKHHLTATGSLWRAGLVVLAESEDRKVGAY